MAAALKVSAAPKTTDLLLSLKYFPSFPILVVFPTPFTPDTTITADTEIFDSDSCYDTNTYTFTPNVAGKYYFFANIRMADNSAGTYAFVSFYKNGATDVFELKHYVASHGSSQNNTELTLTPCRIIDMNGTTDNVACRVQATSTGVEVKAGSAQTNWGAFRLIGA